ncbi:MAG: glycine betaine ABC transporter substrate-binding protein [Gemmatimonadales bacterium]|jgi:osmoprotectant transport system substrate-binding protein
MSGVSRRGRRPLYLGVVLSMLACGSADTLTVVSKNFTESVLLGEIVAQQLERHGFSVDRRLNLGGTFICHEALRAGQADVYVEYTGTAYSAILALEVSRDRERVRQMVDSVYRARWDLVWMSPLGFDNTFAILVRGDDARRLGLTTVSDAVSHAERWRPGFGYEFMERDDGFRGLVETYRLQFANSPVVMDLGLLYLALAEGEVDMVAGNSTDGRIAALDLVHLRDDRGYFPPYEAAPVVRQDVLQRHPGVRAALAELGGTINVATMQRLNAQVDVERRSVRAVARDFLEGMNRATR